MLHVPKCDTRIQCQLAQLYRSSREEMRIFKEPSSSISCADRDRLRTGTMHINKKQTSETQENDV